MSALWLLDVDGVLNAATSRPSYLVWPDWTYVTARTQGIDWPIWYSPTVIRFIRHVQDSGSAEVRWLTTWENDANGQLAERLGLPSCSVAGCASPHACGDVSCGAWWKWCAARAVQAAEPGRPVVWTDDDLRYEQGAKRWAEKHGVLAIAPETHTGLTPAHLSAIAAYLNRS